MSRRGDGYDSRLITRFSASATIIVLYANESSAWASTSRRISLVSTVTSEVWKHMPMVNAKYAEVDVGRRFLPRKGQAAAALCLARVAVIQLAYRSV